MEISFEMVTVKTRGGRELLSNVTGTMLPGTFTSLMGSSGSGKTTLLSTLSRRFEASLLYTGNIRYNGRKWASRDRRSIAFVQQDDLVPTYLTVEEFLRFSARLRLDVDDSARMERVERVIEKLKLQKCRGTVIGGPEARGVSGGERKRTSIANELLTEPLVIFTDEPTSGLDSTLSNVVIDILKDLTRDGLTVVTTIHSPSSSIFDRFDSLIVLDEGQIFFRGKAKELVQYMNDVAGKVVPAQFNPADYLMDLLVLEKDALKNDKARQAMASFTILDAASTASSASHVDESMRQGTEAVEPNEGSRKRIIGRSSMSMKGKMLMRNVSVIFRPGDYFEAPEKENRFARPFFSQVALLIARLWKKYKKDILTRNQITSTLGLSLISGLLYFQAGYTEREIFSRISLCLWLSGTDMYLGVFSTAFSLQDDIPLVKKELYDGTYSLAAHVLAKQIVLYPNSGLWSIVFCTLVLACSRLAPSVGTAVLIILSVQASVFLFQGVGFLVSAAVPTSGLLVLCVLIVTYFFAFNGFFAPFALMPAWYQWLRWPGLLTYTFQLVMNLVFGNNDVVYSCNQAPLLSSYNTCLNGTTITGSDILDQWDIDLSPGVNIAVMLCSALFIRFMAYVVYSIRMSPPKGLAESTATSTGWRSRCCCRPANKKTNGTDAIGPQGSVDKPKVAIIDAAGVDPQTGNTTTIQVV